MHPSFRPYSFIYCYQNYLYILYIVRNFFYQSSGNLAESRSRPLGAADLSREILTRSLAPPGSRAPKRLFISSPTELKDINNWNRSRWIFAASFSPFISPPLQTPTPGSRTDCATNKLAANAPKSSSTTTKTQTSADSAPPSGQPTPAAVRTHSYSIILVKNLTSLNYKLKILKYELAVLLLFRIKI